MNDVHKCILNDVEDGIPVELSDEHLNVHYGMYPFACKSHGGNDKVSANIKWNGKNLYKIVVPCQPNKDLYQFEDGSWNMKKIRDTFVSFLCSKSGKNPANYFVAWDQDSHDLTQNPPRSLDHCLTDECVGDVSI